MVSTVLEKRGYMVDTAHDGQEAYDKAVKSPPDLVITDVMMPKMDGWALIRALRAHPEFAFVPVVFLTALGSDDDRIRGFRLGADDYLPKPFRFEELDLRVTKTLKRSKQVEQMAREQVAASAPKDKELPEAASDIAIDVSPDTSLAGNLKQLGLPSLLTLLEMERKTGVLLLARDSDSEETSAAQIRLLEGKCIYARFDNREDPKNEDCIYTLLGWSDGRFEFLDTEVDQNPEMEISTMHLLMEGARRVDEDGR